ncbi:hypothetical protein BUALT_Bualt15G0032400 [Buddleja alternifolia]|uniref:Fe2OG dioxygenase domain-containing protein n=1 Tax=Buddleja alternifolia TaxID=168488 RepID=A0AAV6WJZ0_9LAMI|nr:hypothetical protein BUALT_Bualt15G0032400 [Buddleja alternifolia]
MGEVHPDFIQTLEHQPKLDITEAEGIPLIDLSPLNSLDFDTDALARLVAEIGDACKNWGFFHVINHWVPLQALEKVDLTSRKFFALSRDEKRKVRRSRANPVGYSDFGITKNNSDWKEVFDSIIEDPIVIYASDEPDDKELKELHNQWPQEVCEGYNAEMQKLSNKLMKLIALSLGLEKDRFDGFFKEPTTFTRLNYYPASPDPQSTLGLRVHKDAGALTILVQDDVGGLEVKRKGDDEWISVKPIPGAYIVNVGDLIQIWSNDKYESVEHRVKANSEKERYSIAFFLNPSHYIWVEPLEEFINEENSTKHKGYRWGKYYATRKLSNFKKVVTAGNC